MKNSSKKLDTTTQLGGQNSGVLANEFDVRKPGQNAAGGDKPGRNRYNLAFWQNRPASRGVKPAGGYLRVAGGLGRLCGLHLPVVWASPVAPAANFPSRSHHVHCRNYRKIQLSLLAALCVGFLPTHAQTPDSGTTSVAVIAATDYNELITDLDYLGQMAAQPKAGQMLENMVNMFTNMQGLQGLDKDEVWGAIIQTDGSTFNPIVCLPVTDLQSLLGMLGNFGIQTSDVGDGIIEIESPNESFYVKEADGWAFLAQQPELLSTLPQTPTQSFKEITSDYDLGAQADGAERARHVPHARHLRAAFRCGGRAWSDKKTRPRSNSRLASS